MDAAQSIWDLINSYGVLRNFVAIVTVFVVIWRTYRKRIKPLILALFAVEEAVPVLMSIAREFKPNGGNSLHDRLVRIEEQLATAADVIENTESTVEAQERMVIRLLVAMADGFRRLGHEVIVDLPAHSHDLPDETGPSKEIST